MQGWHLLSRNPDQNCLSNGSNGQTKQDLAVQQYQLRKQVQAVQVYCLLSPLSSCMGPRGLTFTWWGCCGSCQGHTPTELAYSFLICSCVYFCFNDHFNCISFHKFCRQLSAFSLFSSSLNSDLLFISIIYLLWKSPSALI